MGTTDYMAPEQWEGGHAVDIRADLYSLGCTLFTLLTGGPPFGGADSLRRKMAAHLTQSPPRVPDLRPDVPARVADVVARLLAKDPADRYATPADVAAALAPFAAGADLAALAARAAAAPDAPPAVESTLTAAAATTTGTYRDGGRRPRRPWAWVAVGACGLAVAAALAVAMARRPGDSPADPGRTSRPGPAPAPPAKAELVPGQWHDLLERRPIVALWPDRADSRWDHDPANRSVWVHCTGWGMLQLAEIDGGRFDLEITVSQNPWAGGVGVYFRSRDEVVRGKPRTAADLLSLDPLAGEPADAARLKRGLFQRFPDTGQAYPEWYPGERIVRPWGGSHRLSLTVGPAGLESAAWDGTPVGPKVRDPLGWGQPRSGSAGAVGVFFNDCAAVIQSARIYIHPTGD
jgi:hypothetical protein